MSESGQGRPDSFASTLKVQRSAVGSGSGRHETAPPMSQLGRLLPAAFEAAWVRYRLGFRMPAQRERSTGAKGAGVRKPPMKEPAGRRRAAIRREFEGPEAECLQHVE